MNAIEYVGMSQEQQTEGKRHLLYAQMELLSAVKRYSNYKKLRKQELALKNLLKKHVKELHDAILKLDSILPKMKIEHVEVAKPVEISKVVKRRSDLEQEIEDIKRRIEELQ